MKSPPLLTIGLPTYNRSRSLKITLTSLLKQSYRNIEIIISDNNSSDETQTICKQIASKDNRVKYYLQKNNIGGYGNHSYVLNKAHGKYFVYIGDDDTLSSVHYYKKIIYLIEKHPRATVGLTDLEVFDDKSKFKKRTFRMPLSEFETVFSLNKKFLLCPFLKHPEFFYALFYGIYKTSVIKNAFLKDPKITPKVKDFQMIRKLILEGDAVYVPSLTYIKRDTGYIMTSTDVLRNLSITKDIIWRMYQYLSFPYSFLYDCYFAIPYIIKSKLTNTQKIVILGISIEKIFIENYYFAKKILGAVIDILIGLSRKFSSGHGTTV